VTGRQSPDTSRLESAIGTLLRVGVLTSTTLLTVGLVMSMAGIGNGAAGWLLSAAVIILLATPPARVFVSVIEYLRERDWLFVVLTTIVLLTLAGSVIAAFWR
jgi:uncharacterized membrane protein